VINVLPSRTRTVVAVSAGWSWLPADAHVFGEDRLLLAGGELFELGWRPVERI
jgi:hypothetical protein